MSGPSERQLAEAARVHAEADLRAVLATPEGRRVLWSIIEGRSGMSRRSYVVGDALATAYHEGRRSVGLDLMAAAQKAAPANYVHMVTEALVLQRGAERRRAFPGPTED